jgi:hypothetical protein
VEGGGDSHDHLLAGKQGVADELAGAQSNLSVGHFSGDGDDESMVVEKCSCRLEAEEESERASARANSTGKPGLCAWSVLNVLSAVFRCRAACFIRWLCKVMQRWPSLLDSASSRLQSSITYNDTGYITRGAASDSSVPQTISAATRHSKPDLAIVRHSPLLTSSRMDIREPLPNR